jgi:hypothetical protein
MTSAYPSSPPPDFELKLARAYEHMALLYEEMGDFTVDMTERIRREDHPDGLGYSLIVDSVATIRPKWTLIIGDCLNNLRSTLDQIAYAILVRSHAPNPVPPRDAKTCMFPIAETNTDRQLDRLRVLPKLAQDAIINLQPYSTSRWLERPEWERLWALEKLVNIDKHRRLHVLAGLGRTASYWQDGTVTAEASLFQRTLVPNTEIMVVRWRSIEDASKVNVHFEPAFDITLQETDVSFTGFDSPGLPHALQEIAEEIEGTVIPALRGFL